ncbi:L,D-transpeptidase family protein [Actimicrobium sp. CCC2.4]|uniref:L,D-transpeptidase family protein n=1 Tax=Actimicrobium sp. CCC2.4 TaxID=3048606 RepID=UPI002AC8D700|nr:L,D-transpeptidase family protein [Actimicrobium sp. CCC2.4]WPX31575.1 L,D-transpeptidase family protein [Actimicrobium sp. CCC2.4]
MNYVNVLKNLLSRSLIPALMATLCLAAVPVAQAAARVPDLLQPAGKPDPDSQLIAIYKDLSANNLRQAQLRADALVTAYPNFLLAQLVRGDLLMMHTRPVTGLGTLSKGDHDKLNDLREEAMVRLNSLRERPDPELVPRALLKLRDDQRFAFVVDTKRSRLYVYQNTRGQLKLLSDYYITQGKLGSNKLTEGDQKTPLGVYYITGRLGRNRLPDFYGAGALPINYPNEWDRMKGRSGSGIWLHGTPSTSYSRPPLASDGCVVLTNPDLEKLFRSVEPGKTPVVISEQVEFVSRKALTVERDSADGLLDEWRRDLESLNTTRFMNNYSAQFKSALGEDLAVWSGKHLQAMAGIKDMTIKLQDVTMFAYPGHKDLIVSTFTQASTSGKRHTSQRKRQYWAKEGRHWKIVYEGIL